MATQAESLVVGLDLNADQYLAKMKKVDAANDKVSTSTKTAGKNVGNFGRQSGMAGIQKLLSANTTMGGQLTPGKKVLNIFFCFFLTIDNSKKIFPIS